MRTINAIIKEYCIRNDIFVHYFQEDGERADICVTRDGLRFTVEEPGRKRSTFRIFGIVQKYYQDLTKRDKKMSEIRNIDNVCDITIMGCGFLIYEIIVDDETDLEHMMDKFLGNFAQLVPFEYMGGVNVD